MDASPGQDGAHKPRVAHHRDRSGERREHDLQHGAEAAAKTPTEVPRLLRPGEDQTEAQRLGGKEQRRGRGEQRKGPPAGQSAGDRAEDAVRGAGHRRLADQKQQPQRGGDVGSDAKQEMQRPG